MATPASKVRHVVSTPIDKIVPSPSNPRKDIAMEPLKDLSASIKARGLLQPIIVRKHPKNGGRFEIVVGERRYRASKMAGLESIDTIIMELDDLQVRELQHVENIQREDVTPLDQANSFAVLQKIDPKKYSVDGLAEAFNIGRRSVYTTLQLAKLHPDVQALLREGIITAGHALVVAPLSDEHQVAVAKNMRKNDKDGREIWSVRELKRQISDSLLRDLSKQKFPKDDPSLNEKMGPCTTCRFNTTVNPEAFPDEKSDRCMNAPCFEIKVATFVKREADKLAKEAKESGEKVIQIVGAGADWKKESELVQKGALPTHAYKQVKHNAKGAVKAVVVGGDGAGATKWVMPTRDANGSPVNQRKKTPAEREKRSKEILENRIKRLAKRKIYATIMEAGAKSAHAGLASRLLVKFAIERNYASRDLLKFLGIVDKDDKPVSKYDRKGQSEIVAYLEDLPGLQLAGVALAALAFGHDPFGDQWMDDNTKTILKDLKIDTKAHLADAKAELTTKNKQPAKVEQTSAQKKPAKGKKTQAA
jgi:ParB/RepB/Spo0J family partition protein